MTDSLSQQGQAFKFDILVIGTGLAGLHYCLQVLAIQPHLNIALICKTESIECNSRYAQGGIAAVFSPEDSLESHVSDTLVSGDGLCYLPAVEFIIRQGPDIIKQLTEYSVLFKREQNGEFNLAQEGGHSHRRIFNCDDQTGLTVTQTLNHLAHQHSQITFFEHHIAVNLITQYLPHRTDNQGEVLGAYILDCQQNRIHTFLANWAILLSTPAALLLLSGPHFIWVLVLPYIAWLLVRHRPARSYPTVVFVLASGVILPRVYEDPSGMLPALAVELAVIAASAWAARAVAVTRGSRHPPEESP